MNKRTKIILAVAAAALLLLLAVCLKQTEKTPGQVNSVESVGDVIADKTLKSKREAYDAFANEKESFYNRPAGTFERSFKNETQAPTVPSEPVPAEQPIRQASDDAQFDVAYREVEQSVRGIYEDNGQNAATNQSLQDSRGNRSSAAETPDDRRRSAMREDWGMSIPASNAGTIAGSPMFRAVIHGTQLLKSGQVALFRTKEPIQYGDLLVPANTLLSGFASISSNRLTIKINSVRINREVFALPLEVYGSDGIPGIPLNYDEVGHIADAQATSTAMQEASSAASRYGGTVGRIAGAMISGVGGQVRSAKNVEVKLIDNQTVILKIAE